MLKKFCLPALAAIFALIGLTIADSMAEYACGDANSDGALNVSDAVYIINHVFVGGDAPDPNCCDSECPHFVIDIDSNIYFTVKIGDQCWMAQNLKVTHYRNGDPIPDVTNNAEWEALTTGACCVYDYNTTFLLAYGMLYNWYAVNDSRGIAPEGWHIPSDAEWQTLADHLGGNAVAGGKMKESLILHWVYPNTGATNESGFTGLPGGSRYPDGIFLLVRYYGRFWSATTASDLTAWSRHLICDDSLCLRDSDDKHAGFSVRCVKD